MARPLRIEIAGGRYHVTSRGNERRPIFRDERDRCHFLELLEQWPPRFGVRLHAYVLMDNHYHLVLETPEANLSRAAQWLNLSYSAWFNRRHRHIRHLFQGRFKAIVLEGDAHVQQVARYVHLNPVRVMALDLGKSRRKAVAAGLAQTPRAEVIRQRLEVLRKYRWSSYGAVAGYRAAPEWLWVKLLQGLCGGRNQLERLKAVRLYTEQAVREGLTESPWEGLISGLVLGSEDYARQLFGGVKRNQREESAASRKRGRIDWGQIVKVVEKAKGEAWETFSQRHGDWGRDAAFWLGRFAGRMRLGELAAAGGGCDYTTVAKAVNRFGKRLVQDRALAKIVERMKHELSRF